MLINVKNKVLLFDSPVVEKEMERVCVNELRS